MYANSWPTGPGRPGNGPRTTRSTTAPDSSSFPSGHTAAAAAFTAAAAPSWPPAGALCAAPTAIVAIERIQSGAHYPSDVATGTAIGRASAWLTRHAPRLPLHHWP
jgi:membrane-associated phospholipid phosphatase